jgi:uncharacterized coiled-coil protein SlyX
MQDLERRLEKLEIQQASNESTIAAFALALSNLIKEYQRIREDVSAVVVDLEADGNSSLIAIRKLQEYVIKLGKFIHALDAKNTALATVICRQMDWDPDVMLKEYFRVVEDFGTVENLIDTTKIQPKQE